MNGNYTKPKKNWQTSKEQSYSTVHQQAPYRARLAPRPHYLPLQNRLSKKTPEKSNLPIPPIVCKGCVEECQFCFKPCYSHTPPCSHPLCDKVYPLPSQQQTPTFTCHFCLKTYTLEQVDIFTHHITECAPDYQVDTPCC